jgi:uncharacterized membrane-anchored protein YjiN (DUF445 family)
MRWGNKADKTLFFAALLFIITLILKVKNPADMTIRFFSFCAEAALIGGVADWFAVTALFKKPLGFPYHTAILPRRREQFTLACVRMVQEEFFSKKSIFQRIKRVNFLHLALNWLDTPERKNILTGWILQYIEYMAKQMDLPKLAEKWEMDIKEALRSIPQAMIYQGLGSWVAKSGKDQKWLSFLLQSASEALSGDNGRQKIQKMLEDFRQEKVKGNALASFFSVLAEASNFVNFAEAAEILQTRILQIIEELQDVNNPARQELLASFYLALGNLVQDEKWQDFANHWREELLENISFKNELQICFADMLQVLLRPASKEGNMPGVYNSLGHIIQMEIDSGIEVLKKDTSIQKNVDRLLYDMVGRTALKAQLLVGEIAETALKGMTDEQINRLIYSKVEPDLLWIRMNGSIVGAIVGACLFIVLEFI